MNAIPLINNIPKTNINNEKQLRQEINTSLVALKKEAGTLEGLINEAAQMLVTINNRIATLENDTVKKSDIVDVVQSGNLQPVTSNAVADKISSLDVSSVGGNGKYISAISETDGKINATATDLATSITSGGTTPPTSGAVNNILGRMNNNGALSIGLKGTVWLKIGEFPNQGSGFVLELNIENQYTTNGSSAKRLVIIQGTASNATPVFYIEEKTASTTTLLTTLRIGYNQNWNDTICIYLKYVANANYANPFRITFKYVGSGDFAPAFTLSTQTPTERQQNVEYALHASGLYINGTKIGG